MEETTRMQVCTDMTCGSIDDRLPIFRMQQVKVKHDNKRNYSVNIHDTTSVKRKAYSSTGEQEITQCRQEITHLAIVSVHTAMSHDRLETS